MRTLFLSAAIYLISQTASADFTRTQAYDSALAYGRTAAEAKEAATEVRSSLSLQVYLTLSTPDYYTSHADALAAAKDLRDQFSFQVYLTLRTPTYRHSHAQSLVAARNLRSVKSFQAYLHLLVTGSK